MSCWQQTASTPSSTAANSPSKQARGTFRAALGRKRINGGNDDALGRRMDRHAEPDDDKLSRWRLLAALDQLALEPKQVCRCLGDLRASEFYFHGNPSSIAPVDNGIDLEIVGVVVMGHR